MTNVGYATVSVLPTTKGFGQALSGDLNPLGADAGRSLGGSIMGSLKSVVGPAMLAAGALALGNFVGGAITSAGALEQSMGAIDAVFKGSSAGMHAFAASASSAFGLTRNEANELATVLGTQLKNGGTAIGDLGGKTQELIALGGDMAAMFGGSTADAVGALSSALKGERDPIERYGVSLTQAAIDAEAASLGFAKVGGSLSTEASQAATLSLIMKQTADAHGALARESGSLQAQQARLSSGWENLQASIGQAFLPAASSAVGLLADLVAGAMPLIGDVGPALASIFGNPAFSQLGAALAALLPNISPVGIAFQALAPVLPLIGETLGRIAGVLAGALTTAATALTPVIQTLTGILSGVLAAVLPVIATLFEALAPVLTTAADLISVLAEAVMPLVSTLADILMPAVEALLPVVQVVFGAVADIIRGAMNVVQGIIATVTAVIKGDWSGAWDGIKQILSGAWEMIVGAVRGAINLVVEVFRGLLPAIGTALAGIGTWLFETGRDLIQGLINGVGAMAGALWDGIVGIVRDAVGGVLDFLGIHSPSRLFMGIGRNVGLGLIGGMDRRQGAVADSALGLADAATSSLSGFTVSPSLDVPDVAPANGRRPGDFPGDDPGARGDSYPIHYYDYSSSTEDKAAKLARARAQQKAATAAGAWR